MPTCKTAEMLDGEVSSADAWLPTALLPILQILGMSQVVCDDEADFGSAPGYDAFGKVDFVYGSAAATAMFGKGVKAEGSLVVAGTEGYVFVPAPWWKTDYFEIRREDQTQNRRFFYQLDGEGISQTSLPPSPGLFRLIMLCVH